MTTAVTTIVAGGKKKRFASLGMTFISRDGTRIPLGAQSNVRGLRVIQKWLQDYRLKRVLRHQEKAHGEH